MDCNKDDALLAKSIAESMLQQNDFFGAKKFALKAQALYPEVAGVSQILAIIDVHVSSENKINGVADWYGVLGVNPSAEYEAIKKQYRKLALLLHPDKNKHIGADDAFKLISEAWGVLQDETKRLAYDQSRAYDGSRQQVPMHSGSPSAPFRPDQFSDSSSAQFRPDQFSSSSSAQFREDQFSSSSSFRPDQFSSSSSAQFREDQFSSSPSFRPDNIFRFASSRISVPNSQDKGVKVPPTHTHTSSSKELETFWTRCPVCRVQLEYPRMYQNQVLRCPNCSKIYLSFESPQPPVNIPQLPRPVSWKLRTRTLNQILPANYLPRLNLFGVGINVAADQTSGAAQAGPSPFMFANYQQGPFPGTNNIGTVDPSIMTGAAYVVPETANPEEEKHVKRRKPEDDHFRFRMNANMAQQMKGFGTASASGSTIFRFSSMCPQPSSTRESSRCET